MPIPSPTPDALLRRAERLLRRDLGEEFSLHNPQILKESHRSLMVRCRLDRPDAPPTSVIVRSIRSNPACGFSDWASLEFLSRAPATIHIAPRFLAGNARQRVFVMEDLGSGHTLSDVLLTGSRARAESALMGLTDTMAQLYMGTLNREEDYVAHRNRLPGARGLHRRREAARWLTSRERMFAWWHAVDLEMPIGVVKRLQYVARVYEQPGSFLCLSHGDPAPSNNWFSNGQARLLDFEYGAYRHALYDLSAWNTLCPLPRPFVAAMRRRFRAQIRAAGAAPADDQNEVEGWACLCAFRALAILTWIPLDALRQNASWVDAWSQREAVLSALARMREAIAPIAVLDPLQAASERLLDALARRWPEQPPADDIAPRWPALEERMKDEG